MGADIWENDASTELRESINLYRRWYTELPTNSQFTEQGVKESGYVSFGRRIKEYIYPRYFLCLYNLRYNDRG